MINVDISNIWGEVSLPKLLAMEKEVFDAHMALTEGSGVGNKHLGWLGLPTRTLTAEHQRILEAARRIREESEICVVVGIGGSFLGARAVIELLQGRSRNIGRKKGDPMILFAGNTLSSRYWNELTALLEGKDFSVIAISKSGTTMEPAIALRSLRRMLEKVYGPDGANRRIYAVTDPCQGALRRMAEEQGWESFAIPIRVGGRYSVLSPAGLLPMAVAGIDIEAVLAGAIDAKERYDLRSFENPVWLYAAVRNLLYRSGKKIEVFESFEPGFAAFGAWWRHLFAESEGKDGKGIFPVAAELTGELHTMGQLIQEGERNLFETMLRFDAPEDRIRIPEDAGNADGLNYLQGRYLDEVDEQAFQAALAAHVDGGVSVITVDCGALEPRKVGELIFFLQLGCALSGYILGVNPFNQPGVAQYKHHLYTLLGRPGYDK